MRENDEKDDSGGSDDNTTTIEFTNPTVSQLFKRMRAKVRR